MLKWCGWRTERDVRWGAIPNTRIRPNGNEVSHVAALTPYRIAFEIALMISAVALIISILLQARGAGLGSVFGGTGTVFKTRRGIDRLLFRLTIIFMVIFSILCIVTSVIPA
jgi:preprotein translocase subunit SecG